VSAYVYAFLRQGELILLIPGLPRSIDLGRPMPFVAAVAITMLVAAALGSRSYASTFRPLLTASPVAKAVASLGVMVVITGVIVQRVGNSPVAVLPIFSTDVWVIGSIRVPADRVWFALTVVALTAVVVVGYRTRASGSTPAPQPRPRKARTSRASLPTGSPRSTG